MSKLPALASVFALTFATATTASAQEAEGSISLSSKDGVKTDSSSKKGKKKSKGDESGKPFMKQYMPERNMLEVGIFGGILLPSSKQH